MSDATQIRTNERDGVLYVNETRVVENRYEFPVMASAAELDAAIVDEDDWLVLQWRGYEDRQWANDANQVDYRDRVRDMMLREAIDWLTERGVRVVAGAVPAAG